MWARKEVKLIFIQMFDVSDGRRKMGKEGSQHKIKQSYNGLRMGKVLGRRRVVETAKREIMEARRKPVI